MQNIATAGFAPTTTITLIGMAIVPMMITRSFMQPLYIIAAYYTLLGISEWIGQTILGVDYSIFFMIMLLVLVPPFLVIGEKLRRGNKLSGRFL